LTRISFVTIHVRSSAQAVSLAAGCVAAAIDSRLETVSTLINIFPPIDGALRQIRETSPAIAAFSIYSWNRTQAVELAGQLRAADPHLCLIAGGPEATADGSLLLAESCFDYAVAGEGEEAFSCFIRQWQTGTAIDHPQIMRSGQSLPLPRPLKLATLPSPWLQGVLPADKSGVLWEISRGCPFACTFCFDARGEKGVRVFGESRIKKELTLFVRQGIEQIWILDSTFNFPRKRALWLLDLLTREAPHIHYHLEAKAQWLDREIVRKLAKLNCSLQIGLQSADPDILKRVNRPFDQDLFIKNIGLLNRSGITFGLDLIFGLPGDSYENFCASIDFAIQQQPNHLEVFPLAVLPGTVLYAQKEELALVVDEEPPYQLREGGGWKRDDLEKCRQLALAIDLFYNIGRATAFLPDILKEADLTPAQFFSRFSGWLPKCPEITAEEAASADVLALQEEFVCELFAGREDLSTFFTDLLLYHFNYAETLLASPVEPGNRVPPLDQIADMVPRFSPLATRVNFSTPIVSFVEGSMSRKKVLKKAGGAYPFLFFRQQEIFTLPLEAGEEAFFSGCDGTRSVRQIVGRQVHSKVFLRWVQDVTALGVVVPVHLPKKKAPESRYGNRRRKKSRAQR